MILYFLTLQLHCKNDHPSQMFHMWKNSWKQVGSLSWPSASRIYRRVGIISVWSLSQMLDEIAQRIRYLSAGSWHYEVALKRLKTTDKF